MSMATNSSTDLRHLICAVTHLTKTPSSIQVSTGCFFDVATSSVDSNASTLLSSRCTSHDLIFRSMPEMDELIK